MSRWQLAWILLLVAFSVAVARMAYAAGEVDPAPAELVSGKKLSGKWRIANPEFEDKAQGAGLPRSFSLEVQNRSHPSAALSQGSLTLPNGEIWRGVGALDEQDTEVRCVGRFESGDGFRLQVSGIREVKKSLESGLIFGARTSFCPLSARVGIGSS